MPRVRKDVREQAATIGTVDADGKIKTHREYFDQVEILTQLGLIPAPAAR